MIAIRFLSLLIVLALLASPDIVVAQGSAQFEAPIRLTAGEQVIDTGENWGHSGPCFGDYDSDGLRDLIVGDFSGRFQVFRNVGTATAPQFASGSYLQAGGEDAKVWIY